MGKPLNGKPLLGQIAGYLDEEGLPHAKGDGWCEDGSDALLVKKTDGWPTVIRICARTSPDHPPMVTFWAPVLEAIGHRPGQKKALKPGEEEAIQKEAINQADLLNGDPLIGRWNYNHGMNRIDLGYEMLAVDLTRRQLVGVIALLMKDAEAGASLQGKLGGMDWFQQTEMALDALEKVPKKRTGAN